MAPTTSPLRLIDAEFFDEHKSRTGRENAARFAFLGSDVQAEAASGTTEIFCFLFVFHSYFTTPSTNAKTV